MSRKSQFWFGVLLVIPAFFVVGTFTGIVATAIGGTAGDVVGSVLGLAVVVGLIVGVAFEKTRWFVAGMLAGGTVVTVLVVVAVVVVVTSFLEIFS